MLSILLINISDENLICSDFDSTQDAETIIATLHVSSQSDQEMYLFALS
jgi:hypothetical protein